MRLHFCAPRWTASAYSGKPARDILRIDALSLFDRLGLREHLTPQRSNGLKSMVGRIRAEAQHALAAAAA
jgi:cysteine desulfuration protein SufE